MPLPNPGAPMTDGWAPPRPPTGTQCPLCANTGEQWPDPHSMDGTATRDEPRPCPRGPHPNG